MTKLNNSTRGCKITGLLKYCKSLSLYPRADPFEQTSLGTVCPAVLRVLVTT